MTTPSEWEGTAWGGSKPDMTLSLPDEDLSTFVSRLSGSSRSARPWRVPTVRQALGVPSIQRAVSLISSTTGMLSMQGFQRGAEMADPPRLIVRPDPYQTPQSFYAVTAACMAKYGEFVWYIAARDSAGFPSALVVVPLNELKVDDNPDDRLSPRYTWGGKVGTRYSGANTTGAFVHEKYPGGEPLALRGEGPLQMCRAATSVTVEAQEWAANFYADGGNPSVVIKHSGELSAIRLDPDTYEPDDENGLNEAERLRAQWVDRPHNVPRVIDQNIESVDYHQPNQSGAQMLDARHHQTGETARMFGIPGTLLEYQSSGSSLTYQNLEDEYTKLVRTCLQPIYLEPIEQAMSDLLPRSITSRFNVDGFLRADIKTRFEVHQIAIEAGIYDAAYAKQQEGILPGDVEYAPVPFSPPSAFTVPRAAARPVAPRELAMRDVRCPTCQRLLVRAAGPVESWCRHCKATVTDGEPMLQQSEGPRLELHAHFPADFVRVDSPVTVHPADISITPTFMAPEPAPLTVHVEQPGTEAHLSVLRAEVAAMGADIERGLDAHDVNGRLDDLAARQDSLAKLVAAPRTRKVVANRDEQGRITDATVIDEPAA